ncbi:uncharacterized protein EKO05_0005268 [Ascochyta rabiei]|uniref:uncharacterized protein n=1 Tax=Didymella rabiei TaxID=5454 RepID=UPI0021FE0301|nr:uncharacterized protein EKO05_0005268 [Ascochyta rabiei]UPX14796.1 hypothetical protein EKO05_0005268 [Ascochyta rabiei]
MAISTRCISVNTEKLLHAVKKLVGELDFSFHIVSTNNASENSSAATLVRNASRWSGSGSGRSKQE